MENNIRYIIETYPFLLDMYNKDDLIHIKDIYFDHVKHKRINADWFTFEQYVSKLHELGYKPHKFSIIRINTTKPFSETNIHLKKANNYQKKLDELSKIIKKTERHKIKLKLNENPYIIIKSENMIVKPAYKLHTKQQSPTSTTDLTRYYSKKILNILRSGYGQRKRRGLLADGFTFEKYIITLHLLGYVDGSQHKICRIDRTKKFDQTNIKLTKNDRLLKKIEDMSAIVRKNKRVALKIDEEKAFIICLKHPHRKFEKRIYIKQ